MGTRRNRHPGTHLLGRRAPLSKRHPQNISKGTSQLSGYQGGLNPCGGLTGPQRVLPRFCNHRSGPGEESQEELACTPVRPTTCLGWLYCSLASLPQSVVPTCRTANSEYCQVSVGNSHTQCHLCDYPFSQCPILSPGWSFPPTPGRALQFERM